MEQPSDGRRLNVNDKEEMYRQIVEYSIETTVIHSNKKVLYINQSGADFLGASKEALIGANLVDLFPEKYRNYIIERIRKGEEEQQIGELIETQVFRADGSIVEVELFCHPVLFGDKPAIQSMLRDISKRKQTESQLKELLNDVSTPVVPVSDGIAVLPLVGRVDQLRSQQLLDAIPGRIEARDLDHIIIDVSGVYQMDSQVVDLLTKLNGIFILLGVQPICTGLRPEMARHIVNAGGISLGSLKTVSTVKQALQSLA